MMNKDVGQNVPTARLDILVWYNRFVSNLFQELRHVQQWIKERFDWSLEAHGSEKGYLRRPRPRVLVMSTFVTNPCNTCVKGNKGLGFWES